MVILEAIVSGLPVLTTATCGYAFHVKDAAAGRVLPAPFRQDELNAALEEMLCSIPGTSGAKGAPPVATRICLAVKVSPVVLDSAWK